MMEGDIAIEEHQRSLAAPLVFLIVLAFQFASHWIDDLKKVVGFLQFIIYSQNAYTFFNVCVIYLA
jgi:hypothetical protein